MTTSRYHKLVVLCTSIFCIQTVALPTTALFSTSVEAIDVQEVTTDSSILANDYLDGLREVTEVPLRFSPSYLRVTGEVTEPVSVSFYANQQIQEAKIRLPKEAVVDKDRLPVGLTITETAEENHWLLHSEIPRETFTLPLVFQESGTYEASIEEAKTTIEITDKEEKPNDSNEEKDIDDAIVPDATAESDYDDNILSEQEDDSNNDELDTNETVGQLEEINQRDVSNWQEFIAAMVDPTINFINVIDDFESANNPTGGITGVTGTTSNPNGGAVHAYVNASQVSRSLVIEGNGHQIDFRAVSLGFYNPSVNPSSPWDITLQNVEIYHGNWYGPIMYNDLSIANQAASKIHYHNVKNVGNQLLYSVHSAVTLSGTVSSNQVATYTSKFRTQNINAITQANFEINQLEILDNSIIDFSSINSGNIDLLNANGRLVVGDNVEMTLRVTGSGTGEALGANLAVRLGSVWVGKNSKINFYPQNNYPAITLPGASSRFEMAENSHVNIISSGRTVSTNGASSNIVFMAGGSTLHVGRKSLFEIEAVNQSASASNVIHVAGAGTFIVDKEGTLDIKSDSTAAGQSLIAFTSPLSTFTFADAQRINLERTSVISGAATTNGLINITTGTTGLLDVDIQEVKQWQRGNLTEEPDFSWTPIFNLKVNYSGTQSNINNVSSISQEIVDNFRANFTTRAQRILFEYIPDVEVTIDPLSEDPKLENSRIIRGKATPYSMVRLSGDPAIPEPLLDSPSISESGKFHIEADANGDYMLELPEEQRFTVGNEVQVYAFLNGKSDTASTIVEHRKVMPPVDPLDPEVEVSPDNRPEISEEQGLLSIDFVSQFNFKRQGISLRDQTYYAQPQHLLNKDGMVNETHERPNYIQVSDRRPASERNGWQLAVTQKEQFSSEAGKELAGAQLQLSNQQVITAQNNDAPSLQLTNPVALVPGNKRTLIRAEGTEGIGTWIYRFGDENTADKSVALEVPKGAIPDADSYSTTLIWELSSVPGDTID